MKFSLFRKQKKETEAEPQTAPSQEEPQQEAAAPVVVEENKQEVPVTAEPAPTQEVAVPPVEKPPEPAEPQSKTYLKAMPLRSLADVESVKNEVQNGNIIILRVTPLASKSIEDVKSAVNDLTAFAESVDGDIARLGEERVVICPKNIRIWREKSPVPSDALPTATPTAA